MKRTQVILFLLVFLLISASGSALAQDTADPMSGVTYLFFDKTAIAEGTWEGTVGGDIVGILNTQLLAIEIVGPVWFVEFDWIVEAGDQSFTARMTGTLNTLTGTVVMTGEVVDGYQLGMQVYEQGQMANSATGRFQGTILILPAEAA